MDISKHRNFLLSEIKVNNPNFSQDLIMDLVNIMADEGKPRHNRYYSDLIQQYFPHLLSNPLINNLRDILNLKPLSVQIEFYEELKNYMKQNNIIK
mgnify:CR=1 FL=1